MQEADKLATTQWVAALNMVQAQVTHELTLAGNVLETARGVAVRDWRSSEYASRVTNEAEATLAQRAFNTAFVAGASAFSSAETQAWADHASAVAMAQANRATGEATLFGTAQTMIRSARYFETQDWYIPQTTAWGLFRRDEQMAGNELQSDLANASRDYQESRVQQGLSWTQTALSSTGTLNSTLLQTLATQVAGEDAAWASFATSANALTAARIAAENGAFETGLLADLAVDLTRENALASAANTFAAAAIEAEATEVVTKVDVAFTRALAEAGGIHVLHVAQADADQAYQQQERILSTTAGTAETLAERNTVVAIAISDTARQHGVWNATANYTATLVNAQKVVAQATESARGQFRSNMQVAEKTFAENVAELEAAKRLRDLVISYDTERIRYAGLFQRDIDRMLAELEAIRDSLASTHGGITPTSAGSLLTAQRQQEPILRREPGFWGFVEGSLNLITGGASREVLASPEFGRVLNAVDGFFAGWAHGLTAGLTTRLRSSVYGGTASRNHSGTAFDLGNAVGEVHLMFLQAGNPCSMGPFAGAAKRVMSGLESVGGVINAWDNVQQGNYAAAGLNLLGAAAGAFQAARACFSADTQLMVSGGFKRIDQFQENDLVFARNEFDRNGPIEAKHVEEVFVRLAAILELRVAGKIIRTTSEHPFDDQRRGWTPAAELAPGDLLSTADGRWVAVEQVTHTGKFEMVYNLRVADYHTYFVGGADWNFNVWAHNAYSNAGGRLGDSVTRRTTTRVIKDLKRLKFDEIETEVKFARGALGMKVRYADVVATKSATGETLIIQIGRTNRSGIPVIRERRAIRDIILSSSYPSSGPTSVIFVKRGATGVNPLPNWTF